VQLGGAPDQPALQVQDVDDPSECAPVPHARHPAGPVLGLYLPGAQAAQKGFPGVHPALQMHAATALPLAGESEFAGQGEQATLPGDALYVPAAHPTHRPPSAPVQPATQRQAASVLLLAGETVCAGQPRQPALPGSVLYVSAAHPAHAPPLAPCHPALHTQAVTARLLAGERELSGHGRHTVLSEFTYELAAQ